MFLIFIHGFQKENDVMKLTWRRVTSVVMSACMVVSGLVVAPSPVAKASIVNGEVGSTGNVSACNTAEVGNVESNTVLRDGGTENGNAVGSGNVNDVNID